MGVGVLGVALLFLLWGIGHDLPQSYYPDEAHFVKRSLSFGNGDLNPHWFHKPALLMYILFGAYGTYYVAGRAVGAWGSADEFGESFVADPGAFYLIGRLVVAAFALGSILVVWRTGTRCFGRAAGWIAALLLTLTYGFVDSSQSVKADVPALFFAVLGLHLTITYLEDPRSWRLLVAAGVAGLGAATKYYPAMLLAPIGLALLIAEGRPDGRPGAWPRRIRRGGAAVAVFLLAFFAGSPYSFIDPLGRHQTFGRLGALHDKVLALVESSNGAGAEPAAEEGSVGVDARYPDGSAAGDEASSASREERPDVAGERSRRMGYLRGLVHYGQVLVRPDGMGPVVGSLCLAGLVFALLRGRPASWLLLSYIAAFVMASVLLYPGYAKPRHQVPIHGFAVLPAAALLAGLYGRFPRARWWLTAALAAALAFPAARLTARAIDNCREDSRGAAAMWIHENLPAGTRLLVDENGPPLVRSPEQIEEELHQALLADPDGQFTADYDTYLKLQLAVAEKAAITYRIFEIRKAWWRREEPESGERYLDGTKDRDMGNPLRKVGVRTLDAYRSEGYQYAVISSEAYAPYLDPSSSAAARRPAFARLYRDILEQGEPVVTFSPETGPFTGPEVKILRIARETGRR